MTAYSGVSAYAAMNPRFPQDALFATLDAAPNPALTVLWGTFADATPANTAIFHRFTARYANKPHLIEIHPINNTAIRNKKQYEGEPFPQFDINKLNKALENKDSHTMLTVAARIQEIRIVMEACRNPNTFLMLSTGLEDNYTTKAFKNIYAEIVKHWPYFIVRSGSPFGATEAHGTAKLGGSVCVVNVDGKVLSYKETAKWMQANKPAAQRMNFSARFPWYPQHQGRDPRTNAFPPGSPRNRTFTYTAQDVNENRAILAAG